MGTWKLYEINGTQETLITSYTSNVLNQQFNNPKPIETKEYRISFTDNDGCTGSQTFTIPGCTPADCIVLTSSDVLEINNETNTITVNYEEAWDSYIYFDGPSQDSLSFKVKCDGMNDYMPVNTETEVEAYEAAGGWAFPAVGNAGTSAARNLYIDRNENDTCPTDTTWAECCAEGACSREASIQIYVDNVLCKTIKVIQKKGFECRQMTWKHVYHGNVFDNLPTELDTYGNPKIKEFILRAGSGINSGLGVFNLLVKSDYNCLYANYDDGKRKINYHLDVKYTPGITTSNCPEVYEYPGRNDPQHTVLTCLNQSIPITGEGSNCLTSDTFIYPRNLSKTIKFNSTTSVDGRGSTNIDNIYLLYDGYVYKLGGACGPDQPCAKSVFVGDCDPGTEDCGIAKYTYCTAKGDETGYTTSGDIGPKRIFVCTITFKFTLDEEIIDVELNKVCEGDNCIGSEGGCANFTD